MYVLGGTVCFGCSWLLVVFFVVWSECIKGFWGLDIYLLGPLRRINSKARPGNHKSSFVNR